MLFQVESPTPHSDEGSPQENTGTFNAGIFARGDRHLSRANSLESLEPVLEARPQSETPTSRRALALGVTIQVAGTDALHSWRYQFWLYYNAEKLEPQER